MRPLKATLIEPEKRKAKIGCCIDGCDLSYSAKHYNILYDNQKLAYFKFKPKGFKRAKIFCHDCLYRECNNIRERERLKKLKLIIDIGYTSIICTFNENNK